MSILKNQRGILPLFLLIAIGVAVLAGGTYLIRNEFVKTGKSGKAEVDKVKVREQINNPKPLPSLSPTPKSELQYGSFKYQPSASPDKASDIEPSFSINAPSGWTKSSQSDNVMKVKFEAPDEDQEVAGEDLQATNKAKVQMNMVKGSGSGDLESFVDYFISSSKSGWESLQVNSKSKTTFAGLPAYRVEVDVFKKGVTFRTLSYVFIKGKFGFAVYGGALKSAWDKREPEIHSSLNSFKLSN